MNDIFVLRTPPRVVPSENPITFTFSSNRMWDWDKDANCNYTTQDKGVFGIWRLDATVPFVLQNNQSPYFKIGDYYFPFVFCNQPYFDEYSPFITENAIGKTGCQLANDFINTINNNLLTQDLFYAVPVGQTIVDCNGNSITSTCNANAFSIVIVSKQIGVDLSPSDGYMINPPLLTPSTTVDNFVQFSTSTVCAPKEGKLRENYLLWIQAYAEFQAYKSDQYKKLNVLNIYPLVLPGQNYDTQLIGGRFYRIDIQKQLKEVLGQDVPVPYDRRTRVCYNSLKKFKIYYGDRYTKISADNLAPLQDDKTYSYTFVGPPQGSNRKPLNPQTVYSKAIPYSEEFIVLDAAFDLYKSGLYTEYFDQGDLCIANAVYPYLLEPWFEGIRRFLNHNGKTIKVGDLDWLYFWTDTIDNPVKIRLQVTKYQNDGTIETFLSTTPIDPSGCRAPINGFDEQLLQIPLQTIWDESDFSNTNRICIEMREFDLNCQCEAFDELRSLIDAVIYYHGEIGEFPSNAFELQFLTIADPNVPITDAELGLLFTSTCYTYTFNRTTVNRLEVRATSTDPTLYSFVMGVGYDNVNNNYNSGIGIGNAVGIQPTINWINNCPSPIIFCPYLNRPTIVNGAPVNQYNCGSPILLESSTRVSEPITYYIDNNFCNDRYTFVFKNSLGQYESFWISGNLTNKYVTERKNYSRNFLQFEDTKYENRNNGIQNKLISAITTEVFTLNSSIIKRDADTYKDFINSNQIWFIKPKQNKFGCIDDSCSNFTCDFPSQYQRSYVKFVIRFIDFQPNDYFGLRTPFNVACTLPTMRQWLLANDPTIEDYFEGLKTTILPEPNYQITWYLGGDGDWRLEVFMLKTQAAQFGYTAAEACNLVPRICQNRPSGGNALIAYETAPYCCSEENTCRIFDSNWAHIRFDVSAWPATSGWGWTFYDNLPCINNIILPGTDIPTKLAQLANVFVPNGIVNVIAEGTSLHVWYNIPWLRGLYPDVCNIEDFIVLCNDPDVIVSKTDFICNCTSTPLQCDTEFVPILLDDTEFEIQEGFENKVEVEINFSIGRTINTITS